MKALTSADESLLRLVSSHPERSRFILKLGAAGAVAIALGASVGGLLLSWLIVLPVTLVLLAAYGSMLVLLTWRLVRDADRWQVQSALQARRLIQDRAADSVTPRLSVAGASSEEATSFHHLYLLLRLEEEVQRCRRQGSNLSVVCFRIGLAGREPTPAERDQIEFAVARLATDHARLIFLPSRLGPCEYVFCLPSSNQAEARATVSPMLGYLGSFWCDFGIATYPMHGADAESLVEAARQRCEAAARDVAAA